MNKNKIAPSFLIVIFLVGIAISAIPTVEARGGLTKTFRTAATGAKVPLALRNYKIAYTNQISAGSFARSTNTASSAYKSGAGAGSMARLNTTTQTAGIGQGSMARTWTPAKPLPPSNLHTRGFKPAAGTRIIPEGVPRNWRITSTKAKGGVAYTNPSNKNEVIRVMQGNPKSPYANSQKPYVRQTDTSGNYLTADGNRGLKKSSSTHIPLNQFKYRK